MKVEFKEVYKSYKSTVLDRVQLSVAKGEFVYIIGESGAGKTTLLKLLYAEEKADRGQVLLSGLSTDKMDFESLQKLRRRMGIVFQDLRLIEDLSVYDNVALALEISGAWQTGVQISHHRLIEDCFNALDIRKLSSQKVKALSGGEKQRVAIARAVIRQPELLILDEPTAGLDRDHAMQVMDLVQKLNLRGITVILATHDREIVRKVRRRSCILKAGRVIVEEGMSLL